MTEARITINGKELTPAQSMTVRVALNDFSLSMQDKNALGADEHGQFMVSAYRSRLSEIMPMFGG